MNYEKIILELFDRIKSLEEKVAVLEGKNTEYQKMLHDKNNQLVEFNMLNNKNLTDRARDYISKKKQQAREEGKTEIVLLANDIQKALGTSNRTPCICQAMYDSMTDDDEVLFAPPSGKSTTVRIKYHL